MSRCRLRNAFQFADVRRIFCNRRRHLLEHTFLECTEESPRSRQLHLLRRVESALRGAALFHDRDGFLARQTNEQGKRTTFAARVVGCQRLHEPEHAGILQIRELPAAKFSVAACARWRHLSATSSRYSSTRRHLLLHLSFSLLHAGHLSRGPKAYQIAARFRSGRFVFSSAGRRPDCACRRFSSATCQATAFAGRAVSVVLIAYDLRLI